MNEPAVVLDGVSVTYGRHEALRNVTAELPTGAIGLLGPNGAGKSTLIKALLGLLPPSSGRMRVLGYDVRESPLAIRARVGYMPESDAHMPGMTAVSFVAYCGELAGLPSSNAMQRAHEVLFYVGLGEARYRNVETYSTGIKQRIKLAQALVHDPVSRLLILGGPVTDDSYRAQELAIQKLGGLTRALLEARGIQLPRVKPDAAMLLVDIGTTCFRVSQFLHGEITEEYRHEAVLAMHAYLTRFVGPPPKPSRRERS